MSIKSILVYLSDDEETLSCLRAAFELAGHLNAVLAVVYVANPVRLPSAMEGRGVSRAFFANEIDEIQRDKARAAEIELQHLSNPRGIRYTWTVVKGEPGKSLAQMSAYHDLAVVAQSDPGNPAGLLSDDLSDQLVTTGGCPVIVLPPVRRYPTLGRRILVTWKEGVESSRSLHAALPFLQRAEAVTLVSREGGREAAASLERIAEYLRLHGIEPAVRAPQYGARAAEGRVLEYARETRADLIVMGSSGSSRLREMVLGGGRRMMLRSDIPILISH